MCIMTGHNDTQTSSASQTAILEAIDTENGHEQPGKTVESENFFSRQGTDYPCVVVEANVAFSLCLSKMIYKLPCCL
jgi:hypothetical protein